MKEIISLSGTCAGQAKIAIKFDLESELKRLIEGLIKEGFLLSIDSEGFLSGEVRGTFEEVSRLRELLKIAGFKP